MKNSPSIAKKKDAPARKREPLATGTVEKQPMATPRTAVMARRDDRARDRSSLVSYFNDIGTIPTLTKEMEVILAKEIEAATLELKAGIRSIPYTAKTALQMWHDLRAENRVTGKTKEGTRVLHFTKRAKS